MGWIYLLVAGCFEVAFTTAMKASEGFTRLVPSVIFLVTMSTSLFLLNRATLTLPLGTAYAIWVGIGATGTALVGIFVYGESAALPRLFFLGLLIASIIGLKFVSE